MLEEEIVKLRQAVQALTAQLANFQVMGAAPKPVATPEPVAEPEPASTPEPVAAPEPVSKGAITMAELHEIALVVSREKGPKFVKSILGEYGGKRIGVIGAVHYPAIKAAFEKALAE
jgi:hypothetical protein